MTEYIGHYEIISELGRGGMGVVYKAHEQSLNRYVALKVLGEHLSEDSSYVQRFIREARSAAALNDPNIVQIYSVDEFEGKHYFAMEFVSGKSVLQMIRSKGKIEPVEAARLCLQAASGLAAAHEKNIIHRDIKPANLMVNERGLLKITDFGLALLAGGASRLTATGMFMGTPGYLSPEQCRDEDIDARTDIYSLGVTLFEMLTGSIPFKADSPLALLRQILEVEPPDVRDLNPDVPDGLRDILKKMMAKDRDQRYSTTTLLVEDLQAWLENQGVSTVGAGLPLHSGSPKIPVPPMENEETMHLPSGIAAAASQNETEVMAPPVMPPAPVQPSLQGQAPPAPTDRIAGFVAPAAAPAIATPPPPAFSPAPGATLPETQPKSRKSTIPILVAAAVLLLLALGAAAAWKSGGLEALKLRLGLHQAGSTQASLLPTTREAASELSEDNPGGTNSTLETGPGIPAEPVNSTTGSISPSTNSGAQAGNSTSSQAVTSPVGAGGVSAGIATTKESGKAQGLERRSEGGGSGTHAQTSGTPGSSQTPQTAAGSGGRVSPSGQLKAPLSGGAHLGSPGREAPPPPPRGHGVALIIRGEALLADSIEDYIRQSITRRGMDVFDASGIPGVTSMLDSGTAGGADFSRLLRPRARWLILAGTEFVGERQLQYMGRYETEYQGRIEIQMIDLETGSRMAPALRKTIGYTRLNVEEKIPGILRPKLSPLISEMARRDLE